MKRCRAFTIVELLMVIGILALLMGLLLPALSRAREQSKSVKCLSNLRQLGQAAFLYAQTWHGYCPISHNTFAQEWDFDATGGSLKPGILWWGGATMAMQQCPSYDRPSTTITDPFTGYNYNTSYLGGGVGERTPLGQPHVAPMKLAQVRRSAQVAMFGDGQYAGGTNKYMRSPVLMSGTNEADAVGPAIRAAGTQGYRHMRRTNVCYCDGHGESTDGRYTQTGTSSNGNITYDGTAAADGTGFLSADNSAYGG